MVITIDGPAGVGKTTVSQELAKENNFFFVSSGELYRGLAFLVLKKHLTPPWQEDLIIHYAKSENLCLGDNGNVQMNSHPISKESLHNTDVDAIVSSIAGLLPLREWVNTNLRNWSGGRDIIVEGRDMATTVFPEADLKVFLDASLNSRVSRRAQERQGEDEQLIAKALESRDQRDQKNLQDTFSKTNDSVYIDTSLLTIQQVCESISDKIREIKNKSAQE